MIGILAYFDSFGNLNDVIVYPTLVSNYHVLQMDILQIRRWWFWLMVLTPAAGAGKNQIA